MKQLYLNYCMAVAVLFVFFTFTAQAAFTPVGGKQYLLKNTTHDLYLDAPSGQQAVVASRDERSLSQRFTFTLDPNQDKIPNSYRIQQVSSANYLRKSGNNTTQAYAYITTIDGWTDNFAIVIEDSIVGESLVGYKIQSKIAYQNQNMSGTQRVEENRYFCKDANNNNLKSIITGEAPDLWQIEEASESIELALEAYRAAFDVAVTVKASLEAIDSNLNSLKAVDAADYGKFDAAKIAILQKVGTTYSRDQFEEYGDYTEINAATVELQSIVDLKHQYYIGGDASLPTGWYRIKIPANSKYLTYYEGFKFLDETGDDYQVVYLNKTLNNNDTRFAIFPFLELRNNQTTALRGSQNSFFNLCESGSINEQTSYTFKSGGINTNPTFSAINEDGSFTYGSLNDTRDLNYRLLLESAIDFGVPETTFEDGNYNLSFNGIVAGTVEVENNSVLLLDKSYAITRYGSEPYCSYAIGQNDADGYITSGELVPEPQNGLIDALPRPGFTFSLQTGLTVIDGNDPVVAIRYYNLQGMEVRQPSQQGIYIVKKIHQSPKEEVTKIVVKVPRQLSEQVK
ncbi:MAG: hypothetical protein EZS26_000930 [Candidatus Ordinivivax streblomastigis]|uniref:Uncharacterized protein n=1 Tax=Candidatus Ordinivivax streblomastigis TaxID=2540710 RepID=A0A5M8P3C8_9BACT|nr:MAG: hypothetical protein EZS26_000930 [Candidatus Ordinivivax streblomastigis]